MEDHERAILVSTRDEQGRIRNIIDYSLFVEHMNIYGMNPDVYMSFILKTILDDFGTVITEGTQGKVNQEQLETVIIENLKGMLSDKTRL